MIERILTELHAIQPQVSAVVARLSGGSASQALELARCWQEHQTILARMAEQDAGPWFEQPLPEAREDVERLLDGMMAWLRDLAVVSSAGARFAIHTSQFEAIEQQARAMDIDRCIEAALDLVRLRESLEQFANPRLVGALAREKWLSLFGDISFFHSHIANIAKK